MRRVLPTGVNLGRALTGQRRRGWLALWLQDRRRRRVRGALTPLLPAPVLSALYPSLLSWEWDLADPARWNVWMSLNGGVSYILIEDYWTYGDARLFAPDGGSELYFIVGVDASGREITERSNAVIPDSAEAPAFDPESLSPAHWWRADDLTPGAVEEWVDRIGAMVLYAGTDVGNTPPVAVASDIGGQAAVTFDGTAELTGFIYPDEVVVPDPNYFDPETEVLPQTNTFVVAKGTYGADIQILFWSGGDEPYGWSCATYFLGADDAGAMMMDTYYVGTPVYGAYLATVPLAVGLVTPESPALLIDNVPNVAEHGLYGGGFVHHHVRLGGYLPWWPDNGMVGSVAEVITFNRDLDTTERADLQDYFATRYGIGI